MWKYKVVIINDIDERELNEIGKNGWELVQTIKYGISNKLIFKKFLTEEEYILDKLVGEN